MDQTVAGIANDWFDRDPVDDFGNPLIQMSPDYTSRAGTMDMQALRSAGKWSLGKRRTEASIYQAYLGLIENAERFIYIENQFFISSVD